MPSQKLHFLLLFFFIHFLNSATTEATLSTYLHKNCTPGNTFVKNDAYQRCLINVFDSLSSNAIGKTVFYKATCESTTNVYGLLMCSGYVTPQLCHQCVGEAIDQLSSFDYCEYSKEAIIWYDECMVRYSNRSFFSTTDTSPDFVQVNKTDFNISDSDKYNKLFNDTMNATAEEAANAMGEKKYATKQANISGSQSLYCAAQCTPNLSPKDCRFCLNWAIKWITTDAKIRQGGRMLYPSCNVRFEAYPFYQNTSGSQGTNASGKSRKIIVVVISISSGIILFCIACYFLQKKMRKGYKVLLKEIFGDERTTFLKSLQFSLTTIEAATNKFSQDNKIGKGGFGEVYKGILHDGQEIAIKRLSKSSKQGAEELKNEVLLMAKLQHRNLVTLLGFCLEGQEKILIYEYVPNNSLEYFLFGMQKTSVLNWSERYKIIEGIAQGILYLHKYSKHKIIHRDLKLSNILLDNDMNPKISDFGISKMVNIDENHGYTNRIAGTRGYISPEYRLFGQFSEKSDVFSFGVMVLEIISGKKNANCLESQLADGLLSYAWKQWRNQNILEILDPSMTKVGSQSEIIKCIHIGLLCVEEKADARPPMIAVVQYLNNDSIELPSPTQPAYTHGELGSTNEMSTSEFFPH